jgi:spore germination protein
MDLVSKYGLAGTGIWNIMIYYPQMWLVINTQYEIIKISTQPQE